MVYPCIHMYGALWRHNGNIFMVKSRKINNTDLGRAVGEGGENQDVYVLTGLQN